MVKSRNKFHPMNGKRLVLVVDDERINREMLGLILSNDFQVLYAADGQEALEIIRERSAVLSLIMLDLLMPVLDGFELLKILKEDWRMQHIPVIVLTSEKSAEVESLRLGASDFISKPYNVPEVILARVNRTIELSENTFILQTTEFDALTGLYNKEFFYHYVEQFDQHHPDLPMDAVSIDINRFHLTNELFGREYGNEILNRIAQCIQKNLDNNGIACRREADRFLLYCPHREDYEVMFDRLTEKVTDEGSGNRIRLRMGVYPEVDKSIEVEHRFDCAKAAGDTIRNNFTKSVAYYDDSLHEEELFRARLLDEMDTAIEEEQFQVYYQPKYNIQGERPLLCSAEALIRWKHPRFGMISPGIFISLFEENGLIHRLDRYVWEKTAEQIRKWRDTYGVTIPVSVNVSRIDIYDPDLITTFQNLIEENGLSPGDLLLEVTESAYMEDSDQIIRIVETLRAIGFHVEMDDFGSGYSSLSMLSALPIDALKLDMSFINNIQSEEKAVHMVRLITDIARYLSVPVIAEGVEEEEQVKILKEIGCDIIQGYYFSRPVPADEFETFIVKRLESC